MKNKYISEKERYQIESLLREKHTVKEIAENLGRCKATIYNEIKRGQVAFIDSLYKEYTVYDAYHAHEVHLQNIKEKGRPSKIGTDLTFVKYFEKKVKEEKYSPCAVLADIKNKKLSFNTKVCFKTLYNYVHKGLFLNVKIQDLPYHLKGSKVKQRKSSVSFNNIKGVSIEKRPSYVKTRNSFGHWEMDTVVPGKGKGKECLLVLTERATRIELVRKISDKTNLSVAKALDSIEEEVGFTNFKNIFKTITCDNGVEFLNSKLLDTSSNYEECRFKLYYCHPYSSYERGSNENANKLIRRFIPKGCGIGEYTDDYIRYVQNWMNNYPRKIFGYISSLMYFQQNFKEFGRTNFLVT